LYKIILQEIELHPISDKQQKKKKIVLQNVSNNRSIKTLILQLTFDHFSQKPTELATDVEAMHVWSLVPTSSLGFLATLAIVICRRMFCWSLLSSAPMLVRHAPLHRRMTTTRQSKKTCDSVHGGCTTTTTTQSVDF
jgi:hypothetical protein